MPSTYTQASVDHSTIEVPLPGEPVRTDGIVPAIKRTLDKGKFVQDALTSEASTRASDDTANLATAEAYTDAETTRAEGVETTLTSGLAPLLDLSGFLGAGGADLIIPGNMFRLITTTVLDPGPGGDLTQEPVTGADAHYSAAKMITTSVNAGTTKAKVYSANLNALLAIFQGKTIMSCNFAYKGVAGHAALPALMPRLTMRRTSYDGTVVGMYSGGWFVDPSGSVATFEVFHSMDLPIDTSNVIDLSSYSYDVDLQVEGGANALVGSTFFGAAPTIA